MNRTDWAGSDPKGFELARHWGFRKRGSNPGQSSLRSGRCRLVWPGPSNTMSQPKQKNARYRKVHIQITGGTSHHTLEDLLRAEHLRRGTKPWIIPRGAAGSVHHCLDNLGTKSGCFCGELACYSPGRKAPLIRVDPNRLIQTTVTPVDKHGNACELADYPCFFAMRKNHLAIISSVTVSVDDLCEFFQDSIMAGNPGLQFTLSFQNIPSPAALKKLKSGDVRSIKLSGKCCHVVEGRAVNPVTRRSRKTKEFRINSGVMDLLRRLVDNKPLLDHLEQSTDPGSLNVLLKLSYVSRSEKASQSAVFDVASAFGDKEGLDAEIALADGRKILGDELTIGDKLEIQSTDGNVNKDDATSKLAAWLRQSLESGKIPV